MSVANLTKIMEELKVSTKGKKNEDWTEEEKATLKTVGEIQGLLIKQHYDARGMSSRYETEKNKIDSMTKEELEAYADLLKGNVERQKKEADLMKQLTTSTKDKKDEEWTEEDKATLKTIAEIQGLAIKNEYEALGMSSRYETESNKIKNMTQEELKEHLVFLKGNIEKQEKEAKLRSTVKDMQNSLNASTLGKKDEDWTQEEKDMLGKMLEMSKPLFTKH